MQRRYLLPNTLGLGVTFKKTQVPKFEGNIYDMLGKIRHLTREAYPQATDTESEQHTPTSCKRLLHHPWSPRVWLVLGYYMVPPHNHPAAVGLVAPHCLTFNHCPDTAPRSVLDTEYAAPWCRQPPPRVQPVPPPSLQAWMSPSWLSGVAQKAS